MEKELFCKDCKHFKIFDDSKAVYAKCIRKISKMEEYLVVGDKESKDIYDFCSSLRASYARDKECGPEGKFFEKLTGEIL